MAARHSRFRRIRTGLFSVFAALLVASMMTTPAASATQQGSDALTSEQIQRALLTLSDLPPDAGFMALPAAPTAPSGRDTGGVCDGPDVYALAAKAGSSASGAANFFNNNPDGPYVQEVVFAFPSVAAAKKYMSAAKKQVTQCKAGWSSVTSPDPADPPTHWSIELRAIAKIGDQRFASRATGTGGGDDLTRDPDLPRITDQAIVRVGNHVVLLARYGISEAVGPGRTELEDLAKTAVDHVKQAVLFNKKSG